MSNHSSRDLSRPYHLDRFFRSIRGCYVNPPVQPKILKPARWCYLSARASLEFTSSCIRRTALRRGSSASVCRFCIPTP